MVVSLKQGRLLSVRDTEIDLIPATDRRSRTIVPQTKLSLSRVCLKPTLEELVMKVNRLQLKRNRRDL